MSADPEFFAFLSDAGRTWTRDWVRFVGGDPHAQLGCQRLRSSDVAKLEAHLTFRAGAYVNQGGNDDLTDAVKDSVFRRVVGFCAAMPVIPEKVRRVENGWLYHPVAVAGRAWTRARLAELNGGTTITLTHGEVEPKIRELVAARLAELGKGCDEGDPEGVVRRVADFCVRMKLRKARTKGGPARPGARKIVRTALIDEVQNILAGHEQGFYLRTYVPGPKGDLVPFKPLGPRGALSVSQIHYFHTHKCVRVGGVPIWRKLPGIRTCRSAVATALKAIRRTPVRSAVIDALKPTVRDLVWSIEHDLPTSAVTVVHLDALAGRLWDAPRSSSARANQKRRVAEGLAEVQAAEIGINAAVVDEHAVIGRGRSLPADLGKVVQAAIRRGKVRSLAAEFVPQRQGVWGTGEGQDAQSACRVATSRAGDADVDRVAQLGGFDGAQAMVDIAAGLDPERGSRTHYKARVGQPYLRRNTTEWAQAVIERGRHGIGIGDNGSAGYMIELVETGRKQGAGGVWRRIRKGPAYTLWHSAPDAAEVRQRADRIEAVLDTCETVEGWEAAVHADVVLSRPGRRHTLPHQQVDPVKEEPREPAVQGEVVDVVRTKRSVIEATRLQPKRVRTDEGDEQFLDTLYYNRCLGPEREGIVEMYYGRAPVVSGGEPLLRSDGTPVLDTDGTPLMTGGQSDRHAMEVTDAKQTLGYLRGIYRELNPEMTPRAANLPCVRAIDDALDGAIREGLAEAGKTLKDGGPFAAIRSKQIFETVMLALSSPRFGQELKWRLGEMRKQYEDPNRPLAYIS